MRLLLIAGLLALSARAQDARVQTLSAVEGGVVGPHTDGDRFGVSAARLGDLDGDGTVEVAVGAYAAGLGTGTIHLLSLQRDGTSAASRELRPDGVDVGDFYGTAVAAVGDLDGDGRFDLAVGADRDDDGGENRGAVWVLFLTEAGGVDRVQKISATTGGLTDGPADGDLFGHSVTALGDLDADGIPDLAVGGDDADDGGPNRGAVWILFMNADGTVRATQRISDSAGGFSGALDDDDLFGQAVAGLGDLDGDGVPDLAVAASLDDDGGDGQGAVWILFLNRDGTVRQHQKISATAGGFSGALDPLDVFGSSLVAPGDLNGDGVPDLLVGANRDDDGGPDRGAGWVLFLNPDGTVRAHDKLSGAGLGPTADGDEWNPTAALGDLDGDGAADLLFGSRLADLGGTNRGAARVLFTGYAVPTETGPRAGALGVPFPNPIGAGAVTVPFTLAEAGPVRLAVVDALGREVAVLADGPLAAGEHRVPLAAGSWAPGVYLVRLVAGRAAETRTFVVAR